MSNSTVPVIVGLTVGIGFVVLLASIFSYPTHPLAIGHFLHLTIDGLKDKYYIGENIDFVVKANGYDHLCGYPVFKIVDDHDAKKVVYNSEIISLMGGCDPDFRDINETWTMSQMGPQEGISIQESGNYKVVVEYGNKTVEQAFSVIWRDHYSGY